MKKNLIRSVVALALATLPLIGVSAQERVASGNMQTEASWSAVQTMITGLRGDITLLQSQINQQKACNKLGAFWIPEHSKAVKGCVTPTIVEKETVTKTGKSCNGLGCTVNLNMTPYLKMTDVYLQATCLNGWCTNSKSSSYTEAIAIPTLTSSWNDVRVAGNPPGTKNSSVQASYNASTKILTLKTAYNGKSTDVNLSITAMKNVNIIVKSRVIQLPAE